MSSGMPKVGGAKRNNNSKKMQKGGDHSPEYFTDAEKTSAMVQKRVDEFNASSRNVLIFGPPPEYGSMNVDVFESKEKGKIGFPYLLYCDDQKDEAGNLINHRKDKDYMIVVNTAMPVVEWYDTDNKVYKDKSGNTVNPETVKDRAGMSFVHFLAVPKFPLFNTVTLKPTHKDMLLDMKKTLIEELQKSEFKQKAIERVRLNIINFPDNNMTEAEFVSKYEAEFNEKAALFMKTNFDESNMEFFLHVAYVDPVSGNVKGNQSIPQLHLHCLQKESTGLRTSHRHDKKNMPLDAVLKYLDPSYVATGGKKNNNAKDLKKTDEKVKVGGRELTVHVNKRGTKHVKRGGEFVNLNKALKDASKKNNNKN